MDKLTNEQLLAVFQYNPSNLNAHFEDIKSFCLVCKKWNRLITENQHLIWFDVCRNKWPFLTYFIKYSPISDMEHGRGISAIQTTIHGEISTNE